MATTISKAAQQAGVGVETIRFYERKGLIEQPPKPVSNGGFRHYPVDTVARIRFIRQAQALGFSLREIIELLALQTETSDCAVVRQQAQVKLDEINHKIRQLQGMQEALKQLIIACPGQGQLQTCPIIDALNGNEVSHP